MISAYFKKKLKISNDKIEMNEDFKTSSSIGLLQYLPDELFWNIIQHSCNSFHLNEIGSIISFNFWEHTDATNTSNTKFVEPDVWIETEKYDILIEAKKWDESTFQSINQWRNQIISIRNEQTKKDTNKEIVLIALGGNNDLNSEIVDEVTIHKTSWYNLMLSIVTQRKISVTNGYICRILDDVIDLFAMQGIMVIDWFYTLPTTKIKPTNLEKWASPCYGLFGFAKMNSTINVKYITKWKPIN